MKKTTQIGRSVLVWLLVIASLSSCSSAEDQLEKKKNVALIVKMKHGDYWKTVKMGAEVAAKEFDVNLNFYAPDYEEDVTGQITLVKQAIQDGTNALILAASDYQALADVTEQAVDLNIPVITIDSEVNSPGVKSFIGTDHYELGKKAGEKLIELIGAKGRIAIVGAGKGVRNVELREKGLLEVMARHPQVEIVPIESGYSRIDGIITLDATSSIVVAKDLLKTGLDGKVKVVGIDNPPEVLEYIQEGVIQATIIQKPFSMGYLGVKHAVELMNGAVIADRIDTGTKVIDGENMFWSENQKLLFPFVK